MARPGSDRLPPAENKWSQIVGAESRDEFLRLVQELDPKSFVLRHRELLDYADRYYAEQREPYVGPDGVEFDLGMVPELATWRGESLGDDPVEGECPCGAGIDLWLGVFGQERCLPHGDLSGHHAVPTTPNKSPVQGIFNALLFNLLTKQAEAGVLYSMVHHDLERHFGLDPSDPTSTSWEFYQELHSLEICLTQNTRSLMI
ncbi:putative ORF3 protein [Gemycircularvirus giapa5]|uniref:Putative ORF3 protein n=1 Tax=Giant panda associated gemycircularvirus TaxID=2016461 RepID=A0A220IGQ5_9VIRU|nr:putative ORF3 protein [Giant panda associated gemycircularvirus]ASH99165.1 putative ORF3 protein [Giant panda associated gemycircularvirus]